MGLFRLIFYVIIIWLIAKIVGKFIGTSGSRSSVEGRAQEADPLDLKNADVEDADFEEIDE